jgi:hypothetical protein
LVPFLLLQELIDKLMERDTQQYPKDASAS